MSPLLQGAPSLELGGMASCLYEYTGVMTGSSVITQAANQGMMSLCGNEDAVLYRKPRAAPKEQQQDRHSGGTAAAGTARAAFRPAGSAPLRRIKPSSLVGCVLSIQRAESIECICAPCQRPVGANWLLRSPVSLTAYVSMVGMPRSRVS